jgi:tetratricopeptide (TPR) repeat protein
MIISPLFNLLFIVILSASVYGGDQINYSLVSIAHHDYFDKNPDTVETSKRIRDTLEAHHLHKQVWEDFATGRFYPVLHHMNFILDRMPNHAKALMLIESIARITGNPSLPMSYYERALRSYPQHAFTHAQFGAYLVSIGSIEKGIAKIKRGLEIDPKLAVAYAWLSKAYYKSGNPELGRQAAEQARLLGYRTKKTGEGLPR